MDKFKNQKVLILGLGTNQGGVGAARFFAKNGAEVLVTDLKTEKELKGSLAQLAKFPNIKYVLGQHREQDLDWADLIIKNQAIKPDNKFLKYAQDKNKKIATDISIFLEFISPKQIIGVTGTKGKSTTASLIYHAIKDSKKTILAGNIGKSVLDSLDEISSDTLVVLEISSFQLEGFEQKKVSPHISVITNIFPDHLNYYKNMDHYIAAKKIIAKYQTQDDFLLIKKDEPVVDTKHFLTGINSKVISYSHKDLPKDFEQTLKGEHNLDNYAAALAVSKILGVDPDEALASMNNFQGVEFRLQLIKTWEGIKIYNDTAATSPAATIAALNTFNNALLITGGENKGLPYQELAEAIDKRAKAVYFLEGSATEKLKPFLKHPRILRSTYNNLEILLKDLKLEAKTGDIILFSPGAASFNLFQNEFDRGRKFNEAVEKIFR